MMRRFVGIECRWFGVLLLCGMLGSTASAWADDFSVELNKAIKQLTEEAKNLDDVEDRTVRVRRPHPLVREWGVQHTAEILAKIPDRFTGDDRRDAYIRYHLIYPVEDYFVKAMAGWSKTGKYNVDSDIVRRVEALTRTLPGAIEARPIATFHYEPIEIWREFERLRNQTTTTVGYPPFQQTYTGRAALPHVQGARKAEIEKIADQMDILRKQFKRVPVPGAEARNQRIRDINIVLREYRCRVVYVLLQSGNPSYLQLVTKALEGQLASKNLASFDLLDVMYRAVFDGYLAIYDPSTLERFGRDLERLGRQSPDWQTFEAESYEGGSRTRNFAEYVFTLAQLAQSPHKVDWLARTAYQNQDPAPLQRAAEKVYHPDTLTSQDVTRAFERAAKAINNPPGSMRPSLLPYVEPLALSDRRDEVPSAVIDPLSTTWSWSLRQAQRRRTGNHALATWAELVVGGHYLTPDIYRRLYWTLSRDTRSTFDRSMRLQMLANLPPQEFGAWVRRDAQAIYNSLSDKGNFPAEYTGGPSTGWGEHANGQYGVLGIWAAARAGVDIDIEAFGRIDKHWRVTQHKGSGGWALQALNVDDKSANNRTQQASTPTSPMTAAGVATLTLTERYLREAGKLDKDAPIVSPELSKGVAWLDKNFNIDSDLGSEENSALDWYYYMWTMQRVSQATGYQSFNNINLLRDVTAEVLNRQQENGLWSGTSELTNTLVSTSFAMLFLADALQPTGVAKLRYDGPWNTRPHDIWNFADYVSDTLESPMTWQIVSPKDPLRDLMASPILYMSADDTFKLDDASVKGLRSYLQAGGMLLLNPDQKDARARKAFADLAEQLFPDYPVQDMPREHPMFSLLYQINIPTSYVTNGIRPLIIMPGRDLSENLQANTTDDDSFKYLLNAYLFSVGRMTNKNRLDNDFLVLDISSNSSIPSVPVARIKLGVTDPEPMAMPQMSAFMVMTHKRALDVQNVSPSELSTSTRMAFLSVTPQTAITPEQGAALMKWVESGGTLLLDAAGGTAESTDALSKVIAAISGDLYSYVIPTFEPVISGDGLGETAHNNSHVTFNRYTNFTRSVGSTPLLRGIDIDNRLGIIFSNEDLTASIAGIEHWGIQGYTVETARKLVANVILAATR